MPDDGQGSVTRWIADLKEGDLAAANGLWERYFARMVDLAQRGLRASRGRDAGSDEEDAALSAFDSLCAGLAQGRFPQLGDRDDLWRLLVVITTRKVMAQARRRLREKRGGGLVRPAADLADSGPTTMTASWPGPSARSRPPNSPPWSPRSTADCSTDWTTTSSARSPCSGWKATPATRSPRSWAVPAAPSPANWH